MDMTPDQLAALILHTPVQMSWLNAVLALAPLAAKLFGGASKSRAEARVAEADQNLKQDNAAINRAVVDNNLTQSKQNSAVQNALREGVKDFSITRPAGVPSGRATGGYRPSSITGLNDMGKQFKEADLASIMAGTPKLTPPPQAGKFDKFLNIAGGLAGLAGLAGQAKSSLGGGASVPNVNASVSSDPTTFLKTLPALDTSFAPPPKPIYKPRFTGRY